MALPKPFRLKRRQDFNTVYQVGLRRSSAHLTLRALHQPSDNLRNKNGAEGNSAEGQVSTIQRPPKIGISVSQKVSKRAVVRNRIKRQIQSALQQFLPQLAPNWKLVIVVRPSAIQCDYEQFLQELKQLLLDAEVIDGH